MDRSGGGGGELTATGLCCASCGTVLSLNSKFCNECGAAVTTATRSAEYKQVTVLFADVVHSMDIAAAVGTERLREIMSDLANRCAAVVQRFGGTVSQFTGDGIMAVFGAPIALEDHAIRACLAAVAIQQETQALAVVMMQYPDGIDLRLRVGLNSGEVIAGEIGSGPFGYTTIGEQVGMAQRMEAVAPPGGVMLSVSTARLVEGTATLGEPESVRIKGADQPVLAHRLLGMAEHSGPVKRSESSLVGRQWEMSAVQGLLNRAIDGNGAVVSVVGPAGIGKSRLVREAVAMADERGVDVFKAFCESHTSQVPFHVITQLMRAATGVEGLDPPAARTRIHAQGFDADSEDVLLFEDLLGIRDPEVELPRIDPDARRRRLTALVNAASLATQTPAVYVIEDAHWIDEVSESMLADFLSVIPKTPLLTLITYRPEYRGVLAHVAGAQTLALAPLSDSETAALVSELLGSDPSVVELGRTIAERASGTPFFAEEIVRELAERGVLQGKPAAYTSTTETAEVTVPATLQATIAARIDRLDPKAKRTLNAAAVVGSRFSVELLGALGVEPDVDALVGVQLIDQVRFTRHPEYVFHHPLIRAVAYETQLKSDRAELHRRVAAAIEHHGAESLDENAALIAEHLEAASDLRVAFGWHMRAGAWAMNRDTAAARLGWERARQVADALPDDDPDRTAMRIAPRTALCATSWQVPDAGDLVIRFEELRELCVLAGDKMSLALGIVAPLSHHSQRGEIREARRLASEQMALLESIGDAALMAQGAFGPMATFAKTGEMAEVLRIAQATIDWADGDPFKGNLVVGSPLAVALAHRGIARYWFGRNGWRKDLDDALAFAEQSADPLTLAYVTAWAYGVAVCTGVLQADDGTADRLDTAMRIAEVSGNDFAIAMIKQTLGTVLLHRDTPEDHHRGLDLVTQVRDRCVQRRYQLSELPIVDMYAGREQARDGNPDSAIPVMRNAVDDVFAQGQILYCIFLTGVFVQTLLVRGTDGDLAEAEAATARLAAATAEGPAVREIWLLRMRALLAKARDEQNAYCDHRDRYRDMATSFGFEGHMAWAEAML